MESKTPTIGDNGGKAKYDPNQLGKKKGMPDSIMTKKENEVFSLPEPVIMTPKVFSRAIG